MEENNFKSISETIASDLDLGIIIKNKLTEVGVEEHLKGSRYLITAIKYVILNNDKDILMNDIYSVINKKHNVTKSKAEENIRYILDFNDLKVEQKYLTNKKFISYMASTINNELIIGK